MMMMIVPLVLIISTSSSITSKNHHRLAAAFVFQFQWSRVVRGVNRQPSTFCCYSNRFIIICGGMQQQQQQHKNTSWSSIVSCRRTMNNDNNTNNNNSNHEQQQLGTDQDSVLVAPSSSSSSSNTQMYSTTTTPLVSSSSCSYDYHEGYSRTRVGKKYQNQYDLRTNRARVRNSYLQLMMFEEDVVFHQLYQDIVYIQQLWKLEQDKVVARRDNHREEELLQPSSSLSSSPPNTNATSTITTATMNNNYRKEKKKSLTLLRSKKQFHQHIVTIAPRTQSSLHMTYFFLGKTLKDMPIDEIQRWHTMIRQQCCGGCYSSGGDDDGGGGGGADDAIDSTTTEWKKDYTLRFKGYQTFPPGRNNLLVAIFEPSTDLTTLQERITQRTVLSEKLVSTSTESGCKNSLTSGKESETPRTTNKTTTTPSERFHFPSLRTFILDQQRKRKQSSNVNRTSSTSSWLAHVTLASLEGGSKEDREYFTEWIQKYSLPPSSPPCNISSMRTTLGEESSGDGCGDYCDPGAELLAAWHSAPVNVLGVSLGGPIPDHAVDLDWKFPFHSNILPHGSGKGCKKH